MSSGPDYHGWTHRPSAFGGNDASNFVVLEIKVFPDTSTVATGDGAFVFAISRDLDGAKLVEAHAFVSTVSSSGTPTIQIRNVSGAVDMLSTRITIDASEFTSYTAASAPVVNVANQTVTVGQLLAIDVDVAGTAAKGLGVILTFLGR